MRAQVIWLAMLGMALSVVCVGFGPSRAEAGVILDQSNAGGLLGSGPNNYTLAQTFTCGLGGKLSEIDVYIESWGGGAITLRVRGTTGVLPNNTILGTTTIPAFTGAQWCVVDVSGMNITVAPGDFLAYSLEAPPSPTFRYYSNTLYPSGDAYYYAGGWSGFSGDFLFRTYVDVSPVAEPSAFALLGLGLPMLVRRRV